MFKSSSWREATSSGFVEFTQTATLTLSLIGAKELHNSELEYNNVPTEIQVKKNATAVIGFLKYAAINPKNKTPQIKTSQPGVGQKKFQKINLKRKRSHLKEGKA